MGILIIAGAFWSRLNHNANRRVATSNSTRLAYQKVKDVSVIQQEPQTTNSNIVNVADLPNVNGLSYTSPAPLSSATKGFEPINNPSTSQSPSATAYQNITDKTTLYENVRRYKSSDLSSIVDTNRASLMSYGTKLARTLSGYPFYKTGESPTEIILNIVDDKNNTQISALTGLEDLCNQTIRILLTVATPKELKDMHVDLINSLDRTSQLIKSMSHIQSDKLLALNSARQYIVESKITVAIFMAINKYFNDNNIDIGKENTTKISVNILN